MLTKEKLEEYIKNQIPKQEIRALENIGRWALDEMIKKHGLIFVRDRFIKGKLLTKELLEKYIADGMNLKQICQKENVSFLTLDTALKSHGIKFIRQYPFEEIIGKKFNRLTVKSFHHSGERGRRHYLCQCECGKEIVALKSRVTKGWTKSCGCLLKDWDNRESQAGKSLIGQTYGRLKVIDLIKKEVNKADVKNLYFLKCQCQCGKIVVRSYSSLFQGEKDGRFQSCGCVNKERMSIQGSTIGIHNSRKWREMGWYFIKNGIKIGCKSSYEVFYANYLIDNNIDFEYEPKCFKLAKDRRYTPDFWIKLDNSYIEVKGRDSENQISKRKTFIELGNKLIELRWPDIVKICGLPYTTYGSYLKRANKEKSTIQEFLANFQYKGIIRQNAGVKINKNSLCSI